MLSANVPYLRPLKAAFKIKNNHKKNIIGKTYKQKTQKIMNVVHDVKNNMSKCACPVLPLWRINTLRGLETLPSRCGMADEAASWWKFLKQKEKKGGFHDFFF